MERMSEKALRAREAVRRYKQSLPPLRSDGANDLVSRFSAGNAISSLQKRLEEVEAENERLLRVLRSIRDSAPGSDARPVVSDALAREEVTHG
jgi:hypothetical protein